MSNDINTLNDVTQTLIDSHQGYEKCAEVTDESYSLQSNFRQRAQQRSQLINDFQAEVRNLGGEPQTDGSAAGSAHRAWTSFSSLFQNDEKAAVEAIDDGEDYLAEKIEDKLNDGELNIRTRDLLQRAHNSAREGERFADALERSM